jgi:hypothetical protein
MAMRVRLTCTWAPESEETGRHIKRPDHARRCHALSGWLDSTMEAHKKLRNELGRTISPVGAEIAPAVPCSIRGEVG